MPTRRFGAKTLLAVLAGVVVLVALLTPEAPTKDEGRRTSYATGPNGLRMAFELAERLGWRAERRIGPMDSTPAAPTVQVVIAPGEALGAHEVHRLLTNVRRGGGLIFALDGSDQIEELGDSLGMDVGRPGRFLSNYGDVNCPAPTSFRDRTLLALPPQVSQILWRRPAPGPTTVLATTQEGIQKPFTVGVGFPLGSGRVAVVSSPALFGNDALRLCGTGADIVVARAFEFVRPPGESLPRMVFDEFHHGYGMHGGSMTAITRYLGATSSGRFLTQALVAGLLLVLARAPRPIPPRDSKRVARRSPLEHADALGHAYADVDATRTVTARLIGGLRRRAGRIIPASPGSDDAVFLTAVEQRFPSLNTTVAIVRRGLAEPVTSRELVAIGEALNEIERQITTPPSPRS